MKPNEIITPLRKFLADAASAEKLLKTDRSQFARRIYVRALFAYIEGSVWLLKYACQKAGTLKDLSKISPGEYALLADVTYDLKDSGEVSEQPKFIRLPENLKFCIRVFNRQFGSSINLKVKEANWQDFTQAIKIRNRITHPKHDTDFDIGDTELKQCARTCAWFSGIASEAVDAVIEYTKNATKTQEGGK